jgi:hypothetical protein
MLRFDPQILLHHRGMLLEFLAGYIHN